jgi:hypothetical protein
MLAAGRTNSGIRDRRAQSIRLASSTLPFSRLAANTAELLFQQIPAVQPSVGALDPREAVLLVLGSDRPGF